MLASVTGILAGVALLASWLPANHASRIAPVRALREQWSPGRDPKFASSWLANPATRRIP